MRTKTFSLGGLLLATTLFTGCFAGPHQLKRTVDDWDQDIYIKSPWLSAVLWVVPAFPLANFGASIGDFFVTDAYHFWFKDAWDGKGTAFEHFVPTATDGSLQSLMIEGAKFLKLDMN